MNRLLFAHSETFSPYKSNQIEIAMAFDFKVIIAAGVLMAAHALCFILWISGWFVLAAAIFEFLYKKNVGAGLFLSI